MVYEVWQDDECTALFPANAREHNLKTMCPGAVLLHKITASSWEDALEQQNVLMGWVRRDGAHR